MRSVFPIFIFLAAAAVGWAQTPAGISGRVVDRATGNPLRDARVFVQDFPEASTSTDLEGRYFIEGLPAQSHTLRVFKQGYQLQAISDFALSAGETQSLNISLTPMGGMVEDEEEPAPARPAPEAPAEDPDGEGVDVFELDALMVTADEMQTVDASLLNVRQRASGISDAIGAETFSRLGLGDAAEVMTKVTGASIVDGQYVVIRGLGDRYTNTLLNNISVPSADPDRRAVQLDQFPSEVLESVVISKSFTPDQPGAFSGGSVNMRTRSFPEQFFLTTGLSLDFNTNVIGSDVLTVPGGGRDWLAMDDGTRELPSGIPAGQFPSTTAVRLAAQNGDFSVAELFQSANQAFHNDTYFPSETSGRPDVGWSAAVGDRVALKEDSQLGYILSFTYDNGLSHYDEGQAAVYSQGASNPESSNFVDSLLNYHPDRSRYGFASFINEDSAIADLGLLDFGVTRTSWEVDWSTYGQLAYSPSPNHEVTARLLYNQSAIENIQRGVGESTRSDSGRLFAKYSLLYTERAIASGQLSGKSVFPTLGEAELEWRAAYSSSTQEQPDARTINLFYNVRQDSVAQGNVRNFRLFRDLEEDSLEGGLDLTLPLDAWWREGSELKLGGVFSDGERTYRGESFSYRNQVSSLTQLENYPNPVGIVSQDGAEFEFGNNLERANIPSPDYDGTQRISAGYIMADTPLVGGLRTVLGLRVERTELEIEPEFGNGGAIEQTDLLPALSLIYSLGENMNLRASYGRTLARPTYKELSPARVEDVFLERYFAGNAELEMSEIQNFDLRWEWFPGSEEIVAVSLFYKLIDRPIELVFSPSLGAVTPQNLEEGNVLGLELEYRQGLGRYAEFLNGFTIGLNFALMESEVDVPEDELPLIRAIFPDHDGKRELFDQPTFTFNADLSYYFVATNTSLTLAFNVIGEALTLVNYGALPDYYEQPSPQLDFLVSQRLGRDWQLKFSATNLLDSEREESFEHNGQTYSASAYSIGRSFSIGVSYAY